MVRFKLSRDQTRYIDDHFFPYMLMYEKMQLRNCRLEEYNFFVSKMKLSLLNDVVLTFKRKLLTTQEKMLFKFSDAHGICLYQYLVHHPIDQTIVYAVMLRQNLIEVLRKQLLEYHDQDPPQNSFYENKENFYAGTEDFDDEFTE